MSHPTSRLTPPHRSSSLWSTRSRRHRLTIGTVQSKSCSKPVSGPRHGGRPGPCRQRWSWPSHVHDCRGSMLSPVHTQRQTSASKAIRGFSGSSPFSSGRLNGFSSSDFACLPAASLSPLPSGPALLDTLASSPTAASLVPPGVAGLSWPSPLEIAFVGCRTWSGTSERSDHGFAGAGSKAV